LIDRPRVVVIAGPTATGKTAAALALARAMDGELIGADSVQVYRGFDIGSAKPTQEELAGIPHHLIDVVDPDAPFDAARYAALADEAILDVASRGRVPIVVGGTGLWIRALLRGLISLPEPDAAIRAGLEAEANALGAPALHARLLRIDPIAASAIHPNDQLRIVRALEVHAQTGEKIGELRAKHALGAPRYEAFVIVLDRERDALYAAIHERIGSMLARGWIDEVRALAARWGPDVRAMQAVGYREVLAHVEGRTNRAELETLAYKSTRIYTRRQRTWWASEEVQLRTTAAGVLEPEVRDAIAGFLKRSAG
jgi:tRNA dimethylallyltransferase